MVEDNTVSDVEARWDGGWRRGVHDYESACAALELADERLNTLQAQADLAAELRMEIAALTDGPTTDEWMAMLKEVRVEAAGLRAKAELADELLTALDAICYDIGQGEQLPYIKSFLVPKARQIVSKAKYDALNPQPHHESNDGRPFDNSWVIDPLPSPEETA